MNRGTPPTARNARTGELTPPGVTAEALSKSAADCSVCAGTPDILPDRPRGPVGRAVRITRVDRAQGVHRRFVTRQYGYPVTARTRSRPARNPRNGADVRPITTATGKTQRLSAAW